MKNICIHNRKELIESRTDLRRRLTPSEAFLWKHLRAKQFDGKNL